MQQVNGIKILNSDPSLLYHGLDKEPTWFSAQGGVYQCNDNTTQQPVAIKKYLVENTQQSDVFVMPQELVENEIYTMTKCNHHNIVKLLSVHMHQEFVYLIMPLCGGGSLQQYVFDNHLNFGQLSHIITSIAAGLQEIHRHGYIHRDIKCDNIFLDDQTNQIVIGDFGVVSITPSADSSVEEAGVVLFWAPELVQGKMVDCKVDIWALGIVILEIINGGRAPYEDDKLDEDEIKRRILMDGNPAYPSGLPSRLYDLLDKCLNPDPRARASASDILKHPFISESKHELLFATPVDDQPSLTCIDPAVVNEDSMLGALKMLQEMKPIHEMDSTPDSTTPTVYDTTDLLTLVQPQCIQTTGTSAVLPQLAPPTKCTPSRKCRLPIPSFMLKVDDVNLTPAKDKIANVQLNRQSLNRTHRNQGSRLPMVILPTSETLPTTTRKENKKTRSARLSSSASTYHSYNKSDTSTKYMSADRIQTPRQQKREQQQTSPSSLSRNTKKKIHRQSSASSPTKPGMSSESVTPATQPLSYTQKRLPESRTDRLMMGIRTSTAARGKATSTIARETTPISANYLSSHLTASISGKKRHQEAQQKRTSPICAAISSAVTTAPSHQKTSSSSSSSSSSISLTCLPGMYSPQHNQSHQQQQRQRRKLVDGDRKQRLSTSKMHNRLSSLSTTKKPPLSSLATSNGTIGKNESFKGISVLRAY